MEGNAYTNKNFICPRCGNKMDLDDIDYNFDGNQDNYYLCPVCELGGFEKVRYKKVCKTEYCDEYGYEYDPKKQTAKSVDLKLNIDQAYIIKEALNEYSDSLGNNNNLWN